MSDTDDRRERIEAVSNATADEDRLVTLSIAADDSLGRWLERIEERHAEAGYLGDDDASGPVRKALDRVQHRLHAYEATPEDGLVIYAGVVDGDLVEHVFDDLPAPVEESGFDVSNAFDAAPLDASSGSRGTYGLLVVERGGAALGRLDGDRIGRVETIESEVMGKTRAGGQSARRFERDRDRQKREFFESVAAAAERAFLGEDPVDGLLLGGTTVTVEAFRRGEYLDRRLRDRLVGDPLHVEYASEQGLRQLVREGRERLDAAAHDEERAALDRFFAGLRDGSGDGDGAGNRDEVVYGREATAEALSYDAVETLLVSEAVEPAVRRDLADRAGDQGGECVVVSTEFERGDRFREAFGGIAAVLRFPIE